MKPQALFDLLQKQGIQSYCGVPDSLLKDFCAYITDHTNDKSHTITANEGNAIALAAGHYLATGNIACVYMQNSGLGNCVNPLLSLTDQDVYNIPVLLMVGWRGEPGKSDEPQHVKQGKVTLSLLETMGIKYSILPKTIEEAEKDITQAFKYMRKTKCPYAFVLQKETFETYKLQSKKESRYTLRREEAIEYVLRSLKSSDIIVSTTGHISREVYETRNRLSQSHQQDFLTVGSMGHTSSIALGIALEKTDRRIFCFDGDGALLMHQGALVVNASKNLKNFKHIVFNNEAHDSVGSQPTTIANANIQQLALNAGYKNAYSVQTQEELEQSLPEFLNKEETSLLEIKVKTGARSDLGRPKERPQENKRLFLDNIKQVAFVYEGSIEKLSQIIKEEQAKKVLIFTGKKSFKFFKPIIEDQLKGTSVTYYNNFSTNPKEEEIRACIKEKQEAYDLIIAVGGGSVMDFAKAYCYYTKQERPLIAIPTTAGSGAEATPFAVVYVNQEKQSLDESKILPEYAIVDSQFVINNPKYLKACTAMDAYCQAIESFWAVKANQESRTYAKEAIELCRDNIVKYVNTNDKESSNNMMKASHLAGKAIAISRTTVAHAMSYAITTKYGIPHGHAVALTIANLMQLNRRRNEKELCFSECEHLQIMKQLFSLVSEDPKNYFIDLFRQIDLESNFKKLGITDINELIKQVNVERLNNNFYKLTTNTLKILFEQG